MKKLIPVPLPRVVTFGLFDPVAVAPLPAKFCLPVRPGSAASSRSRGSQNQPGPLAGYCGLPFGGT